MVLVRAPQHQDIVIELCRYLFLDLLDLKLFKAYCAYFILHLALGQFELHSRIVAYFKDIVVLFLLEAVLLVYKIYHKRHDLKVLVILVDCILAVKKDLKFSIGVHVDRKCSSLLGF